MVHTGYNPALVALSVAIAIFASYTALDLGARVHNAAPGRRIAWIGGAALAMGGGIWSMHFIGMLAFEMGMPTSYEAGLTVLSLVIAIGATGGAFAWVGRPGAKAQDILVSGTLMGIGIAGMHFIGMAALHMPGSVTYNLLLAAISVLIAVTAATVGLWLTFRNHGAWQKIIAAFVMGFAVSGMHYTGMAAATFTTGETGAHTSHVTGLAPSQQNLALFVGAATFLTLFLAMLASSIDQQRVQRELSNSEARFRAAIQAVRGVLWTNDAEGRMVGEQPGWSAITGQSFEEYQGFGWANAVHPDDSRSSVDAWNETVREKRTFVHEHRVRVSDGTWRHFAIRAVPVLAPDGSIREWVGVHTDITEQREAEAELRESNEEIQRYAYIVSHDLRAPLVNVMGFTSELDATREDIRSALKSHPDAERIDADLGEALGFISAAVTRMESLIAAILKLSREGRRSFRPEPLDLHALLQRLADAQRHQTDAAGAEVIVARDLPRITADRLALEQIFGNLLDNAVKYLDPTRAGRITVTAAAVGPRIRIDVADNGRGIAERDHSRVFELFRRSGAQDRPGEGIGLAHVKALVRSLGGRIDVASKLGEGTTFSVTLPRGSATAVYEDVSATSLAAE
ncbi:PAS domain S-box protein [Methylobacterium sp. SD274]|uniref:MHYT domain-containing protein n=1 Tax=Methylobacterium sp. SD274 TaxID=2782009 RepID=UPI001A973725|nr:MHYT domain-containing protein [Methylobacterium sp. SD274]MBO1021219.1 PAS domain S-box protein [Methylobacterium sp. SD274]